MSTFFGSPILHKLYCSNCIVVGLYSPSLTPICLQRSSPGRKKKIEGERESVQGERVQEKEEQLSGIEEGDLCVGSLSQLPFVGGWEFGRN